MTEEGKHEEYSLQSLFMYFTVKKKDIKYGAKAAGTETRTQGYPSAWEENCCKLAVCLPIAVLASQLFRL